MHVQFKILFFNCILLTVFFSKLLYIFFVSIEFHFGSCFCHYINATFIDNFVYLYLFIANIALIVSILEKFWRIIEKNCKNIF